MGFLRVGRVGGGPRSFINGFGATDYPFKNFFLGRGSISGGTEPYPGILNANGVPASEPAANITGTFPWPTNYTGRWKIAFTGTGGFQLALGGTSNQIQIHSGGAFVGLGGDSGFISNNITIIGTNPVVEFSWLGDATSNVTFYFFGGTTHSGMDKVIVCRSSAPYASDYADIVSEDVSLCFNDDFIAAVSALRPLGIRTMDWGGINNCTVTRYSYLPQTGYNTVTDSRWVPSIWAGTVSGTNTYACGPATDTPVSHTDGEVIQAQFTNANTTTAITGAANNGSGLIRLTLASTASLSTNQWITVNGYNVSGGQSGGGLWKIQVIDGTHIDLLNTFGNQPSVMAGAYVSGGTICTATLNVNSRGAKPVVAYGGGTANTAIPSINANALATLIYDAAFDAWMYREGGQTIGTSLEVHVALANKLGVDLWYCLPHMMDDAGVTSTINYIKANLNRNLWIEHSNEVWNFIFYQTFYAWNRAWALGIPNSDARREYGGYAFRMRQVMELATAAWSGSSKSMYRVNGIQFFGGTANTETYRFLGSDLSAFGYNSAPNRPIDYTDVISYAPYYSGAIIRNFDPNYTANDSDFPALTSGDKTALTDAADDYASGNPSLMSAALDWVDNDIRAGTAGAGSALGINTLSSFTSKYSGWDTLAASYSKTISKYEGGYEGFYPSTATCTTLGISTSYGGGAGSISTMLAAYKNDARFKQLVLDQWTTFVGYSTSRYPSWYTFGGGIQWSMYPSDLTTTPYKSYNAMIQFNGGE